MNKQINIFIYGKVQGVGYRYSAKEKAEDLGLAGWVTNKPDGSVEILAQGDEKKLVKLLKWSRHGSTSSRVEKVEYEMQEIGNPLDSFNYT